MGKRLPDKRGLKEEILSPIPLTDLKASDFNEAKFLEGLMLVINQFIKSKGAAVSLYDYITASKEVLERKSDAPNLTFDLISDE